MPRLLMILLAMAVGLNADVCTEPGTIEFFPFGASASQGVCHPEINRFSEGGTVVYGQCSYCGAAAAVPAALTSGGGYAQNYLVTGSVSDLFDRSVFTIEFDFATEVIAGGGFPAHTFMMGWPGELYQDAPAYVTSMSFGSEGSFQWIVNNDPFVSLHTDMTLEAGRCYHLSFVGDGNAFYIYVDGKLAGAPAFAPTTIRPALIQLLSNNGGTASTNYFSNLRFSTVARMPPIVWEQGVCLSSPTPSPTMTPTPNGNNAACVVSVSLPADLTVGAEHTAIWTCTPAPSPTVTPTMVCQVTVMRPPDLTIWAPHTALETCTPAMTEVPTETPQMTATSSPTPGVCDVEVLSIDQGANTVLVAVRLDGQVELDLVDSLGGTFPVTNWINLVAGSQNVKLNIGRLSPNPDRLYTKLRATWRGRGMAGCIASRDLPKKFRFYGSKTISQYGTPLQSSPDCAGGGSKLSCIQEMDCTSATSALLPSRFVKALRIEGSGITTDFGLVSGDMLSLCKEMFVSCILREAFRKTSAPTGYCGSAIAVGDFAADMSPRGFGNGTLACGAFLALLGPDGAVASVGYIRDRCPGCKSSKIDRYAGQGGCKMDHFGIFWVVKYE